MRKPLERLSEVVGTARHRLQKADWRLERRPLKRSLAGALAEGLEFRAASNFGSDREPSRFAARRKRPGYSTHQKQREPSGPLRTGTVRGPPNLMPRRLLAR
jgi:hypothetical protein